MSLQTKVDSSGLWTGQPPDQRVLCQSDTRPSAFLRAIQIHGPSLECIRISPIWRPISLKYIICCVHGRLRLETCNCRSKRTNKVKQKRTIKNIILQRSGEYFIYELPHLVMLKMSNQRSFDDAHKRLLIPCGRTISSKKILFLFFSLISSSLLYIIKNNIYFSLFLFALYLFFLYNIF